MRTDDFESVLTNKGNSCHDRRRLMTYALSEFTIYSYCGEVTRVLTVIKNRLESSKQRKHPFRTPRLGAVNLSFLKSCSVSITYWSHSNNRLPSFTLETSPICEG